MRWPVPAAVSSPVPAVLLKLGPLDAARVADLRPYFGSVPDPRSRRGRWYSLTAILLVCACAVISGARSIDEARLAELEEVDKREGGRSPLNTARCSTPSRAPFQPKPSDVLKHQQIPGTSKWRPPTSVRVRRPARPRES
ncbi:transposase family protein [Streptomyces nigra]|uniref:transposase family protein n=1 Tax=Streptomyces nigra TaxID=1827580 RepID=UPI0036C24DAE